MLNEWVVLLHGMARTSRSMRPLENALKNHGYRVVNFNYPSTRLNIESIAREYIPLALSQCPANSTIHFVTHSLGGIVLRKYLSLNHESRLGKVVMLGPPNQGSEVVDALKRLPGFQLINGPAGMELGTDGVPTSLGAVSYPVGVIAGSRSVNPILSCFLPGKNDGKVTVKRTQVDGMKDHIVIPVTHPFIMRNKQVVNQVIQFLQKGEFCSIN